MQITKQELEQVKLDAIAEGASRVADHVSAASRSGLADRLPEEASRMARIQRQTADDHRDEHAEPEQAPECPGHPAEDGGDPHAGIGDVTYCDGSCQLVTTITTEAKAMDRDDFLACATANQLRVYDELTDTEALSPQQLAARTGLTERGASRLAEQLCKLGVAEMSTGGGRGFGYLLVPA